MKFATQRIAVNPLELQNEMKKKAKWEKGKEKKYLGLKGGFRKRRFRAGSADGK